MNKLQKYLLVVFALMVFGTTAWAQAALGNLPAEVRAEDATITELGHATMTVEMKIVTDSLNRHTDVDLLQTPSYSFEARTTDYESRFKLVFATGETEDDNNFAFISDGEIILTDVNGNSVLQIIDMNGRVLSSRNAANRIGTDGLAAGVYVLRLINGDDMKTQKIVIK